jgi:ferredoxin
VEHPIGDSDVLHVPLALKAGFGELGRHGSIIHPKMGPLFRLGSVITDMPLQIDHPIDAGIAAFCDKCRACRIYCPANAIPDERSPKQVKIIWATTVIWWIPESVSLILQLIITAPFVCRFVFTSTRNGRKISKVFKRKNSLRYL